MSILVFGAGFLGERLARELPEATLSHIDIADEPRVKEALVLHRPTHVINAAGKTGRPNVDWCETHKSETYRANVTGALTLAQTCGDLGIHLVHLGSGCIFYGESPTPGGWREDDFANPISFYSRTKYAADLVLSRLDHVAVARLRMPVDDAPHPRNLITKLARYPQVIDVANSVTVVSDLVTAVTQLVERRATGVFHVTNPGILRTRDLLGRYREIVDPAHRCEFIEDTELVARGLATKPRSNCVLASTRLEDLGIRLPSIEASLRGILDRYAARLRQERPA